MHKRQNEDCSVCKHLAQASDRPVMMCQIGLVDKKDYPAEEFCPFDKMTTREMLEAYEMRLYPILHGLNAASDAFEKFGFKPELEKLEEAFRLVNIVKVRLEVCA